MPLYRGLATTSYQHVGEREMHFVSPSNNTCVGTTWGALLPGYDGFDLIGFRSEPARLLYPSNVPPPFEVEPVVQSSTDFSRARVAPSTWWTPQLFDLSPDPTVTFAAAWGAKANMGTGYDVQ
jgi:hypothetical protein